MKKVKIATQSAMVKYKTSLLVSTMVLGIVLINLASIITHTLLIMNRDSPKRDFMLKF